MISIYAFHNARPLFLSNQLNYLKQLYEEDKAKLMTACLITITRGMLIFHVHDSLYIYILLYHIESIRMNKRRMRIMKIATYQQFDTNKQNLITWSWITAYSLIIRGLVVVVVVVIKIICLMFVLTCWYNNNTTSA